MHFITLAVVVSALLLATSQTAHAQCRVRKELRELSGSEKRALIDGLVAMHRDGSLERLRRAHADAIPIAHNTQNFLLWHRAFMWDAEDELLRHTGGLSGLPYIDLTRDARDPASSPAFRNDLFMPLNSGCLFGIEYAGCLQRNGPNGPWGQCADSIIASLIRGTNDYPSFSMAIEGGCHNRVHSAFPNSQLYYTDRSPIDPFFYPMHAGTDYMFAQWQNLHSDAGGMDMNRRFLGRTVSELFAYSEGPRCYRYQGVSAPNNPPTSTTTTRGSTTSASATPTGSTSATPTPTSSPNDGRNAGNATDSAGWIPPFEKIPDEWFKTMPGMFSQDQIDGFNRIFAKGIEFLKRLKEEGKALPTMGDFKSITGNGNWTSDGIKKMAQDKDAAQATMPGSGAIGQHGVAVVLVAAVVAISTALIGM